MKKAVFILITFLIVTNLKGNDRTYHLENLRLYDQNNLMTFMDYSCFDADNCIIVRTDDNMAGLIAEKTSDGGKSWKLLYADTSFMSDDSIYYPVHTAQRVKYFSDGTLIILTDKGKILRSEDYGESFSEFKIDNFYYSGLDMLDKNRAIVTSTAWTYFEGSKNFIKKSYDGCKTWEDFKLSDTNYTKYYHDVYLLSNKKMIINLHSNDSTKRFKAITNFEGSNWQYLMTPRYVDKLHFFDDNEGIGVGRIFVEIGFDTAVISKTYNGGETWEVKLKATFPQVSFGDIGYINDSLIIVCGSRFGLFYSTDKGESWFKAILELGEDVLPSTFVSNFTKITDEIFYFMGNFATQLFKATQITSSVNDATLKPSKIYPNPIYMGSTFTSDYELKTSGNLKMYISDLSGRELYHLFNGFEDSGHHSRTFALPKPLAIGSYWLVSEINGYRHVQMLNVVK